MKDTWMKTLGVDNPLKSTKVREKSYDTMEQKYGSKFAMQNSELHQKYVDTMIKTYGDSIPIRNECIKKSIEHTTEERYGAKHIFSSEYGKQKRIQTSKEKYGTEYPMQSSIVKEHQIQSVYNKYSVNNVFELETTKDSIKRTNLERRGVEYATQSESVKNKILQTKKDSQVTFIKQHNYISVVSLNVPNIYYYIKLLDTTHELDENGFPIPEGVSLLNPKICSMILCNYSKLKENSWDILMGDTWHLMYDFDNLCEKALKKYPLYKKLVIYKIDGLQNIDIQEKLQLEFGIKHSLEYISSLWRNKIPKLIASAAEDEWLENYYLNVKKGQYKKCSRCGQIKLAHNKYFSKNKTSKDGFYSICKECRNKKRKELV